MGAIKPTDEMPMMAEATKSGKGMLGKVVMSLAILIAVLVIGMIGIKAAGSLSNSTAIKGKQYQAVFLTNGQVYFGKLSRVTNEYVKLTDVYYLQVQQTVQPTDKSKTTTSSSDSSQQQVSLAKLGNELHGPEDAMYISKTQVLFWENIKDDGKVVKAIKDYTSKK